MEKHKKTIILIILAIAVVFSLFSVIKQSENQKYLDNIRVNNSTYTESIEENTTTNIQKENSNIEENETSDIKESVLAENVVESESAQPQNESTPETSNEITQEQSTPESPIDTSVEQNIEETPKEETTNKQTHSKKSSNKKKTTYTEPVVETESEPAELIEINIYRNNSAEESENIPDSSNATQEENQ